MRTYRVTLTGRTPLVVHWDNIEWSDQMDRWGRDPKNKSASKPGDDRTPPFRWLGSLYHDGKIAVLPSDNVMASLMGGGARTPVGKGQKTFKSQTQSGMMAPDIHWPLLVRGKPVPVAELFSGMEQRSFDEFQEAAARLGFVLFLKRATIGNQKHIRVRPRFDEWSASGNILVTDESINAEVLTLIGQQSGQYIGVCDWRPSSKKKPGPFGTYSFAAELVG